MLENTQNNQNTLSNLITPGTENKTKKPHKKETENTKHYAKYCALFGIIIIPIITVIQFYKDITQNLVTVHTTIISKTLHNDTQELPYYTIITNNPSTGSLKIAENEGQNLTINQQDTITYNTLSHNIITITKDN